MALTNSQYDIIIRGFEEKQRRNRRLLEERTAYVHSHVEGYRELSDSIASASTAQGRKLLAGDEHALDELRGMIRELSAMKRQLLLGAGLSGDYLDPVYEIPAFWQRAGSATALSRRLSICCMSSPESAKCWKAKTSILSPMNTMRGRICHASKIP